MNPLKIMNKQSNSTKTRNRAKVGTMKWAGEIKILACITQENIRRYLEAKLRLTKRKTPRERPEKRGRMKEKKLIAKG